MEDPTAPRFSHRAEEEFARFLDFHGLRWEYEPVEFELRHPDGSCERFRPDFLLPEQGLFVEVTAARSHNARYKRRRIRLMGEQHPATRVLLFDRRGVASLLARSGRSAEGPAILGLAGQL